MATFTGVLIPQPFSPMVLAQRTARKGIMLSLAGSTAETRWYKLRASCTSSVTGYVEWLNTTGDNAGRPACAGTLGPTVVVTSWAV